MQIDAIGEEPNRKENLEAARKENQNRHPRESQKCGTQEVLAPHYAPPAPTGQSLGIQRDRD